MFVSKISRYSPSDIAKLNWMQIIKNINWIEIRHDLGVLRWVGWGKSCAGRDLNLTYQIQQYRGIKTKARWNLCRLWPISRESETREKRREVYRHLSNTCWQMAIGPEVGKTMVDHSTLETGLLYFSRHTSTLANHSSSSIECNRVVLYTVTSAELACRGHCVRHGI